MNKVFNDLIKNKIRKFVEDYNNLSKEIFLNKNGKLIHPGEFGTYREKIIKEFLQPFLPARLDIGTGFIITSKGNVSTQCDLIIFDKTNTPLIENGEQRFFPIECVAGVVEVKSKLNITEFKKALIKLSNIKKLKNDIDRSNLFVYKNNIEDRDYDTKKYVTDQLATFLICEELNIDTSKGLDKIFNNIYKNIDISLFHNIILSLDGKCFAYKDYDKHNIYYPYYHYGEKFVNICISPSPNGYEYEHILGFLNLFFMLISDVSIMYLEITYYLGSKRISRTIE